MYCKNCGAQNEDNAKFCTSCGIKIENIKQEEVNEEYQDFFDESDQNSYSGQDHYEYEDSMSHNAYNDNRPSNVYGKQFEAHPQGNMSYGRGKSPLGKLIGFVVIVLIIAFAYFIFFSDNGPIYDVAIGAEINEDTYYPDEPLDYVIASNGVLFVSYSARDIQYETIEVQIYYNDLDMLLYFENIYISFEDQIGYFSYDHNWIPGEYEIVFVLDDEEIYNYVFDVETE